MSTITAGSVRGARPTSLSAAVWLTVIGELASLPFLFAPGAGDIPLAGIVVGLVGTLGALVGAWGLWHLRRWGLILTFVLVLLGALASLPGFVDPPSGWILAELIVAVPLSVAILVLIALPSTRRAVH